MQELTTVYSTWARDRLEKLAVELVDKVLSLEKTLEDERAHAAAVEHLLYHRQNHSEAPDGLPNPADRFKERPD